MAASASTKALQDKLRAAGFDPGPSDGINGPKTKAAIKAFQKANGLVVDGIAGPKTMAKLNGGAGGGAGGGSGGGPTADKYLDPTELNSIEAALRQAQYNYDQALVAARQGRSDAETGFNNAITNIQSQRIEQLNAINKKHSQLMSEQPEAFAARGLLRSGLLDKRLSQIRDNQADEQALVEGSATRAQAQEQQRKQAAIDAAARAEAAALADRNFQISQSEAERRARQADAVLRLQKAGAL